MRLTYEELDKIKKKFGVNQLWSFSKFNSYRTSQYEWMLKYLQKKPENSDKPSAYAPMGSICHDSLEKFYNKELTYNELADEFDDGFTTNIEIAGLCFDRSDSTKNENIKTKYYKNLMHYFQNFNPMEHKPLMEQFLAIKIADDIVFQGYADCIVKDDEDNFVILDFKTSTIYKGKKADKESAQLVLYSEALRQKGIPKEKIKCAWNFLKYVMVDCTQVNGKIKTREIERCEIGESLQASAKVWLKKLGYEDQMLDCLDDLAQTNDINCLPEDVKAKFNVRDCIVYVDNIWDLYDDLKEEIISTIAEINEKVEQYNILKDVDMEAAERLFWDDEDSLKEQSYYFNNLCGYSIPTIKPYKEYLDKINAEKNGDIFGSKPTKKSEADEYEEDDLSWLADLV